MKSIKYLVFTFLINILLITGVNAATGTLSLSASSTSVEVGDTTTITLSCKSSYAIGACEYSINYDSSKLKLISGDEAKTLLLDSKNTKLLQTTLKFKVIDTGSSKVSFKTYQIYDYNEKPMTTTIGTTTIRGISPSENNDNNDTPVTYSTNNYLKSLSIEGIKLSPSFNKTVLKYNATVDTSITKAIVKAVKADSKAKISGNKTYKLSLGVNTIKVVVTSEKGTKKTYEISINVEDKNPINIEINNINYSVIKQDSLLTKPNNYSIKQITIDNQKIPSLYSDITKYTLIGLKDPTGVIKLCIYDEINNTYQLYQEIEFNNIKITPLETTNKINKYLKTKITLNDQEVFGYKSNASSDYTIIYGMNLETGEKNWYSYEKTENTIQKFSDDELNSLVEYQEKSDELIKLLGALIIVLTMLIILVASKKTTYKKKKNKKTEDIVIKKDEDIKVKKEKKKKKKEKNDIKLLDEW